MFHTLSTQRNILTPQMQNKDICQVKIQVKLTSKIKKKIKIFLTLETKVCTLKKLQLDFLIMELILIVSLSETDFLLKKINIQTILRRTAAGLTLILLEKLMIFTSHGSLKMLLL